MGEVRDRSTATEPGPDRAGGNFPGGDTAPAGGVAKPGQGGVGGGYRIRRCPGADTVGGRPPCCDPGARIFVPRNGKWENRAGAYDDGKNHERGSVSVTPPPSQPLD